MVFDKVDLDGDSLGDFVGHAIRGGAPQCPSITCAGRCIRNQLGRPGAGGLLLRLTF